MAPALRASGIDFNVRVHNLRTALGHASWLLAGGADLKSVMDLMGHTRGASCQDARETYSVPHLGTPAKRAWSGLSR